MNEQDIKKMAVELRREYRRNWAKANRDKTRKYDQRYWERKAEQMQLSKESKDNGKNEI